MIAALANFDWRRWRLVIMGGLIIGIGVSTGLYGQQLFQFGAGTKGQVGVWLSVLPFLIAILIASIMLSGREQFVEEED